MPEFHASVLLNVSQATVSFIPGHSAYRPGQQLATDSRCELVVAAQNPAGAADAVSLVATGQAQDVSGRSWSTELRQVGCGDVLRLQDLDTGSVSWWASGWVGWGQIPPPPGIPRGTVDLTGAGRTDRLAQRVG